MKPRKMLSAGEVDALWSDLERRLRGIGVSTQPEVAARIVELVGNADAGLRDYADIIRADAALSGRLLRLANSAFFAQRQPVTNLDRACVLLGIERLRAIALGFYLSRSTTSPSDVVARRMWGEGIYRACLASELSRHLCPGYAPEAFCIGLMIDAGMPILVRVLGEAASRIVALPEPPPRRFKAEFESLPFTHVDVAAALARRWKLPDLLARPIERHHIPPPEGSRPEPVYLLHRVAYYVGSIQLCEDFRPQQPAPMPMTAQKILGLAGDQLTSIVQRTAHEYAAVQDLFRDVADSVGDLADMADRVQAQLVEAMDETLMSDFREQTRESVSTIEVAEHRIELELDRQGLAVAYLIDQGGDRFLSYTFTPGTEPPAAILEALGIENLTPAATAEFETCIRNLAA